MVVHVVGTIYLFFGLPFRVFGRTFKVFPFLGFEWHICRVFSQYGALFLCSSCAHMDDALHGYEQLLELQIKRSEGIEFWWWDFNGVSFFFLVVVAWLEKETQSSSIVLGGT